MDKKERNNPSESKQDQEDQKLLSSIQADDDGSPVIRIRTPTAKQSRSSPNRTNSIRLKRFDLISDEMSPHEAARQGRLDILRNLQESGESLEEKDENRFTPLHHAARANQVQTIEFLLDSGIDPNIRGGLEELTPLHVAVRFNCLEATKLLLLRGSYTAATSTDGTTPLHFAARHGNKEISELLLRKDKYLDVNSPDNSDATAFHLVCVCGNTELCELYLKNGANILTATAEGRNSLHIAALYGHVPIVEKLLEAAKNQLFGENVKFINGCDFEDNTPLHLACKKGHVEIVKILLQNDADLEARNNVVSDTPLHVAAQVGQADIVQMLIDKGAAVNTANAYQRLPIHLASIFGHCHVIQCLLKKRSPIDPQDSSSMSPLHHAISAGQCAVTELLLELGADVSLRTESLQTCAHIAVKNKRLGILERLVDAVGGDILEVGDEYQRVPIHFCAYSGQLKLLEFLLSKTINPCPKDIFEKTPLHMAAVNGKIDCVKALAEACPLHISDTDDTNTTPLHEAAKKGHKNVCKYLMGIGADVTSNDSSRWTPLHHAAGSGHVKTVEILLHCRTVGSNQTIDEQDSKGNTPLIIAARNGKVQMVCLLIERGADIKIRNKQNMTCLDEAVENGKMMVVMEIVKCDRWYDVVKHRPHEDKYPFRALVVKMPEAAKTVLDRCIECSELHQNDPDYQIKCDFRLLDSRKDEEKLLREKSSSHFYAPTTMIQNQRESLLSHPLVDVFLFLKWRRIGKPIFTLSFFLYITYVALFTDFLVSRRSRNVFHHQSDNKTVAHFKKILHGKDSYSLANPIFVIIFIVAHLALEVYEILSNRLRYFTNVGNYLDLAGYISSLLFIIPHLWTKNPYEGTGALWPLGACAVLFLYAKLILSVRCFGTFGIYILMFIEILKTMSKVILMFSLFIFAYGLTFFVLLKEEDSFRTLGWTFVEVIFMATGGIDYDGIITKKISSFNPRSGAPYVPVPEFTTFLLIIFCLLMSVLLMNMLIGLAVGDIDSIQKNASFAKMVMETEYILDLEERYPRKLTDMCCGLKPVMVWKPNERIPSFWKRMKTKYFGVSGSFVFRKITSTDKKDDALTVEQAEQKSHIEALQKAMEDQSRLMASMAKQLQSLTGIPSSATRQSTNPDFVSADRLRKESSLMSGPPSLL